MRLLYYTEYTYIRKNYIFSASKNHSLVLLKLKAKLELLYNNKYFIAKVNSKENYFENCWAGFNLPFCE